MIYRFVMLICLLLSLPFLVACSTSLTATQTLEITSTNDPNATQVTSTSTNDTESNTIVALSETYIGENSLVNAVLTVNYPLGWTAQGTGTQLLLASADPETIDTNSDAILINIMPIATEMLQDLTETNPESLVSQAMLESIGQEVEVTSISINNQAAAYAIAELDANAALVYALQMEDDVFVVLSAIKAQAFTSDDESTVRAIAESIQYDAGEIPQSE